MEKESKIISAFVWNPRNALFKEHRNQKAECTVIRCERSDECDLHKRGECSFLATMGCQRCPYGTKNKEYGYTKRAQRFSSWISDRKEMYKDVPSLSSYSQCVARVGDYFFLPYSYITMNETIPFVQTGGIFSAGNGFILAEHFTVDNIINMCEYKPQAMMGGEIKTYQKEVVPKFIKHLSEKYPGIFKKLAGKYPRASEIAAESNVGREAYLDTLKPGIGTFIDIHGGEWEWSGRILKSYNSHASFTLVNTKNIDRLEMTLKDTHIKVKITDDGQVTDKTEFTS